MKISSVIEELQKVIAQEGDLPVRSYKICNLEFTSEYHALSKTDKTKRMGLKEFRNLHKTWSSNDKAKN